MTQDYFRKLDEETAQFSEVYVMKVKEKESGKEFRVIAPYILIEWFRTSDKEEKKITFGQKIQEKLDEIAIWSFMYSELDVKGKYDARYCDLKPTVRNEQL